MRGKRHVIQAGQMFYNLTTTEKDVSWPKWNNRWKCRCVCGNELIVRACDLHKGDIRSCGCRFQVPRRPHNIPECRCLYSNYKSRSKAKGIEFSLTQEEFRELTSSDCHYCGSKPNTWHKKQRKEVQAVPYIHNGIDRVDNFLGYTSDNCVPCCKYCNYMKQELPVQQFLDHVNKIATWAAIKSVENASADVGIAEIGVKE